jgi:chromosomal replication initiation ATPase DnaA
MKEKNSSMTGEVNEFIAGISPNPRDREAARALLAAYACLTDQPVTINMARRLLRDNFRSSSEPASF